MANEAAPNQMQRMLVAGPPGLGTEVVTTVDLRRELGDFLRSRRERRRPEDVATLSAVSVTWYTWLEQGRQTEAAQAVAFFRAQTAIDMAAPEVTKLVADLESVSEEFRTLWRRRDLAAIGSHTRVVHHPTIGRVELELTKMRTVDDELTMIAYLAPPGSGVLGKLADAVRRSS